MVRLQKSLGRVLVFAGALVFACWGYLMLHEFWVQKVSARMLEERIASARAGTEDARQMHGAVSQLRPGEIIGRLEIPRIDVSVIVLEGSDSSILDVAAGHIPGTAIPGASGNVVVAAHRDTFFRSLREIQQNDRVSLRTPYRVIEYEVESTEVVEPSDIDVLRQTGHAKLTLVTCYPFNYIGAAPKRFIVHARQLN